MPVDVIIDPWMSHPPPEPQQNKDHQRMEAFFPPTLRIKPLSPVFRFEAGACFETCEKYSHGKAGNRPNLEFQCLRTSISTR